MKALILVVLLCSIVFTGCSTVKNSQSNLVKKELQENIIALTKDPVDNKYSGSEDFDNISNITFEISDFFDFNKDYALPMPENNIGEVAYNIPIYYDERVQFYLDLYGSRLRDIFQKWIDRSNMYKDVVTKIFNEEGLPLDLICLAFVESGFNPVAVSHAGATGMWQFIQSTGELYGLKNNFWVDDRKDFIKSTRAAAKHLKDLYNIFNDWYLALAAYNAGLYKITSAIERYNTKDFKELSKYRFLKEETKDYVPKFIAILMLYKNALSYGFTNVDMPNLFFDTIEFNKPVNLFVIANLLNISYENIKELNPQLKRPITPPGEKFILKIPYGTKTILQAKLDKLTYEDLILVHIYYPKRNENLASIARKFNVSQRDITELNGYYTSAMFKNRPLFVPIKHLYKKYNVTKMAKAINYDLPSVYIVKKGDTMYGISKKLGIPLVKLVAANSKLNPNRIRPGDAIAIPMGSSQRIISTPTYYTVKRGDTLWNIAKRFNTSVNALKNRNKLYSANTIFPGKILKITD